MSLYRQLYKSLPTQGHSQLENFLTEGSADLMNRLELFSPRETRLFAVGVLLAKTAANRSAGPLSQRLSSARHLRWLTQQSIRIGDSSKYPKRPDIIVNADGECCLLIEVKVAAEYTRRTRPRRDIPGSQDSGEDVFYQLEDYGRWLSTNHPMAGLILLTHETAAPDDFLSMEGDKKYYAQLRSVTYWRNIHKWLQVWAQESSGNTDVERLSRDFLAFIEEVGMSELRDTDLNILNGYLSFEWRMEERNIEENLKNTMLLARDALQAFVPPRARQGAPRESELHDDEHCAFWDYSYPHDLSGEFYVGWGFSPAENPNFFPADMNLPKKLQALVIVSADKTLRELRRTDSEKYKQWLPVATENEDYWIRTTDAIAFTHSDGGFTSGFIDWARPLVREAAEILAAVVARKR